VALLAVVVAKSEFAALVSDRGIKGIDRDAESRRCRFPCASIFERLMRAKRSKLGVIIGACRRLQLIKLAAVGERLDEQ
jgi:hypothetical protein